MKVSVYALLIMSCLFFMLGCAVGTVAHTNILVACLAIAAVSAGMLFILLKWLDMMKERKE